MIFFDEQEEVVRVDLNSEVIADADALTLRRDRNAVDEDRPPCNGAPPNDTEEAYLISRLGTRCEAAFNQWAQPIVWRRFQTGKLGKLPDFDDWIDTKGIRKSHHALIVKDNEPAHRAYVKVYAGDHPTYYLVGWQWGWVAKGVEMTDPVGNRPAHFYKGRLRPMSILLKMIRERQVSRGLGTHTFF